MNLHNTLTKSVEQFTPITNDMARVYSCGPTVYDHIHIGNLSAFVAADTLRRVLQASGLHVQHVMNFTDIDDKTIRRSQELHPDLPPEEALSNLTLTYEAIFLEDMRAIGNDIEAISFLRATEHIDAMQEIIRKLFRAGYAYVADDGVYFSVDAYRKSGKTYGQLVALTQENTSNSRINNDEYDKTAISDFALWKMRKGNEPAWEFTLDSHTLLGRPGWHIECSAMSSATLGQPFDIHTGGVDLIFPHHENEIAQSTAASDESVYARYFVHNAHLLVGGRKMSKSLNNFFTLRDIQTKGFEPLAFRLLVLHSHYRSATNFSWESLQAAQNRLQALRAMADLRWQTHSEGEVTEIEIATAKQHIEDALFNDLATPQALAALGRLESSIQSGLLHTGAQHSFALFLDWLDAVFGLNLSTTQDISDAQKLLLNERGAARSANNWELSDQIRDKLLASGLIVNDTAHGQLWHRSTHTT